MCQCFFNPQGGGQQPQNQHRETDRDAARNHQDDPRCASLLRVQPVHARASVAQRSDN